jgi:hypothetical protein
MRSRAASALAFVIICACKADDQVLTPDDEGGGSDAAVTTDSGSGAIVTGDASVSTDASNGADAAFGADAALGGDAAIGADGGPVKHTAKDPDCDLNGVWIGRQVTESLAILVLTQYANNWYYLEFAQDGEQVVVSKHMDCGIEVHGSALVELAPPTMRALTAHNSQVGRKGTFAKQSDGTCALQMEKFWSVRGVNEDKYAPKPRNRDATIQEVQAENPLPAQADTEDWDGDGQPGIAWQVGGALPGIRHSGQRDWTRWFSAEGYVPRAAMDFTADLVVRAEFSNEEIVYAVEPADNDFLRTLSEPNLNGAHTLTLRFIGRTRDDPRAQAILKPDDFNTCLAIQAALPPVGPP